ncbi:hypothetical protein Ctob_008003 [Chrysochromulina tobinii]|uniref:Uncharacterized protein n=1 Tax=Chrysochromulina tobinii TaxID=1460289 RepID=A0A0M0K0F0_9EUKA|nr:hypothetical protein Ctob_008003 [Chrysochromulina tobinii]|eukprot:KOO31863.1 hypothetical protein Ctob_008003 [Chrysochromulina sp. CCMP291]
MPIFGKRKAPGLVQPELVLPPIPLPGARDPRAYINTLLFEQQKERQEALENERRAISNVADRERMMLTQLAQLRTQVQEQKEEIERAQRTEEDLHKALRLAAERLSGLQLSDGVLRAELDDTRQQLVDTQVEVQTLRARLFGEKGVRLVPAELARSTTSVGMKEDDVIAEIVNGARAAGPEGMGAAEGRAAAARSSRQQLKRLLHFVKAQLAEDVSAFSGARDEQADEISDAIGRRRHLIAKLETALYDLLGGAPPMMLVIEALDEAGSVDADFDAIVLIESSSEHVSGKGFVKVTKGVGLAPLNSCKSGPIELSLQDGGFTRMEPPEPLFVNFEGGPPAKVSLTPDLQGNNFPTTGDPLNILVEIQDRFNNRCTDVNCEVVLAASHGAEFGDGPVQIEMGEATIQLVSEVAATVSLIVLEARGPSVEMIGDEGLSAVAYVPYLAGSAAVVQLALPPGAMPIAGERTKLLVCVADKFGNMVAAGSSNLAADVKVEPGPIGNASVERNGVASIADGIGEVWVRSESATLPTEFYITSAAVPGGLALRHTQDEPFRAVWSAAKIAAIGVFLPEAEKQATVGGGRMVLGVRTEDAYGNPRGTGWDGSVLVLSPSPHVSFSARAGVQIRDAREAKVTIKDGVGLFEMVSDSTEIFQITLRDVANTGLRTTSVLRAQFRSLPGVQCIFGEVPAAAQPVGLPFPLPLLVLDRLGNVADDFEGDIPVKMTGACRTAGGAREAFRAIRGRAALPVLSTIAETVQFTLDPATAILNKEEAAASDALLRYGFTTTLTFGAADAKRLTISALAAAAAAERALSGEAAAPGGEVQVRAGDEVLVAIKALDAYNNLVLHQQCTFFLEVELRPKVDEALTNTLAAREPPQRYMLQLSNGEAHQRVPTRLVGELSLRLVQPSVLSIDLSATAKIKVVAARAVSIDVVNVPEAGRGGVEFSLLVRALDQYGNVDEAFDAEVVQLDREGAPPGMVLQNDGIVKLTRGIGRCTAVTASAAAGSPGQR